MAGPGLPVNIDTTYADSGTDASVKTHQQHHDLLHTVVNDFDVASAGTAGYVPIGNGTVLVTRALLSTDNPGVVVNTRTANYTLVLTDAGKLVEMNVASSNTVTVPPNSSVAYPIGTVIVVAQYDAGTTIMAGAGVTLLPSTAQGLRAQYSQATLTKRGTNEWYLAGDLA